MSPLSGSESECIDAEAEEEVDIPRPIQDVINRYEQRVDEVKEEHDFFHLLKAEGLKRQMALYTFMDDMKQQVRKGMVIVGTHDSLTAINAFRSMI